MSTADSQTKYLLAWLTLLVGPVLLVLGEARVVCPAPVLADRITAPASGDPVPPSRVAQHTPAAEAVVVSLTGMADTVAEGDTATIRVGRKTDAGNLSVSVSLSGSATFNKDYTLKGVTGVDATRATLTLADGQTFVDLRVKVIDDIPAEADEVITLQTEAGAGYTVDAAAHQATLVIPQNDVMVVNTNDHGEGSLRQAILNANAIEGPDTIRFDARVFAEPQTIQLASALPELSGQLVMDGYIEGRLWKASGVTVSGSGRFQVFRIAAEAEVTLRHFTIADGAATDGGAIANFGKLVIRGVTFYQNNAERHGGGLANLGGAVTVINSTFAGNTAVESGGGFANLAGSSTVTNCTFSENAAAQGGGLYNNGDLFLRNSILANSKRGEDCVADRFDTAGSTRNLVETHTGCGAPISSEDPQLQGLDYFNGPTKTYALLGGSEAINLGDNAAAVDEHGQPLVWDQRGNGDPRFVAGYPDLGAFEHQRLPILVVDTVEDTLLRGCTPSGATDCPLRGAIELANAAEEAAVITFDPKVFAASQRILLGRPLPKLSTDITLDASGTGGVTVVPASAFPVFNVEPGGRVRLIDITLEGPPPG